MLTGNLSPVSNRATWSESVQLTDASTGESIDLTAVDEITIEVRRQDCGTAELSATKSGGGVVIIGAATDGTFQWRFEVGSMRDLEASTYDVGLTIEQDDDTVQLLIGSVQVLDGIVT